MKKTKIATAATIAALMALTGCSSDDSTPEPETKQETEKETTPEQLDRDYLILLDTVDKSDVLYDRGNLPDTTKDEIEDTHIWMGRELCDKLGEVPEDERTDKKMTTVIDQFGEDTGYTGGEIYLYGTAALATYCSDIEIAE